MIPLLAFSYSCVVNAVCDVTDFDVSSVTAFLGIMFALGLAEGWLERAVSQALRLS